MTENEKKTKKTAIFYTILGAISKKSTIFALAKNQGIYLEACFLGN